MRSSLLGNPQFPRYFFGQAFAQLSYQMLVVAVGWQVYDLTNSALSLGLIGLVQFLPQLLLALVAGHVADRHAIWSVAKSKYEGPVINDLARFDFARFDFAPVAPRLS